MSTTTNWAEQAAALTETSGTFWKPEEGESLAGRLVSIERDTGQKGSSTIYTVANEEGEMLSFWGSAVIDKELGKLGASKGDIVMLKYFGKRATEKGTEYKSYAVKVLKAAGDSPKAFADDQVPF